ncbi:4'-phosphopantetheinyl transferase superfamily protein [Streptomyces sp. NPDC047315]|uniref:4'-phosphopantetheinyl transferase family protein n=1 Tax=Streptomyces sp. NPDC047315 TaxID=3155142 RepID=UPI0033CB7802
MTAPVPPSDAGPTGPHEVAVWLLSLRDHAAAAARAAHLLDAEEARRSAEFRDEAARARYVTSHVGLRVLLAAHTGTAPGNVEFTRERCGMPDCELPHGRPALAARPDVHFSLSHAGDTALFALASEPVGADIESEELVRDGLARAGRRLHPDERRALAEVPAARRGAAVLGCLVRKEAYLKGTGAGLAAGLGTHHVGLAEEFAPTWAPPGPAGWSLADVPAPDGYRAAVAVQHRTARGESAAKGAGAGAPTVLRIEQLRLG